MLKHDPQNGMEGRPIILANEIVKRFLVVKLAWIWVGADPLGSFSTSLVWIYVNMNFTFSISFYCFFCARRCAKGKHSFGLAQCWEHREWSVFHGTISAALQSTQMSAFFSVQREWSHKDMLLQVEKLFHSFTRLILKFPFVVVCEMAKQTRNALKCNWVLWNVSWHFLRRTPLLFSLFPLLWRIRPHLNIRNEFI